MACWSKIQIFPWFKFELKLNVILWVQRTQNALKHECFWCLVTYFVMWEDIRYASPPLNFTKLSAILQTSEHDLAYLCTIKASVTKCPPCEQGSTTATKVPSQHSGEIVFSARCTLASVCRDVIYEPLHIVFLCGFLISLNARGFWTNKSEMNGKTCFEQLYFYIL